MGNCVFVHFNIACLTGVSFAMHFCVLLQGFMFDWELSSNVLHVISFLYCARCSCETNLHICGVTALRCAFQVISVRLPLPLCMCLRDKGRTHCLLPCCRWAASPDQQPCRPDRRWARLLLQPSLCSPSAAPDSAGRSPLEGGRMTDKQRKRGWVTEKAEGQRKMDILCYCSNRGKQREVTEYQKDCFPKMSSPISLGKYSAC